MAGKQVVSDDLSTLIDQNQQQSRLILVQNPLLTRAFCQAQIMLGMVQPAQAIPNIQPSVPQQPQPSTYLTQQPDIQTACKSPGQAALQNQTSASAAPYSSLPAADSQSQSMPSQPHQTAQQHKRQLNTQVAPASLSQSAQISNIPPLHSASQLSSLRRPQSTTASSQLQQPLLQSNRIPHLPLQPPMPPKPRPPHPMSTVSHQLHSQMGSNLGFQHPGAPQLHHSQPMFHSGTVPPAGFDPSFPKGQQPHQSQAPPQSVYQMGGSHLGTDFSSRVGNSMQVDKGSARMPGQLEHMMGMQLPALPPLFAPAQMGSGSQPPLPPPLSPEMEKALLHQVTSLTPEQINLLLPEQRQQVPQLQQMLRQ